MFQSLILNFVTDWIAKTAAMALTIAATNGYVTGDQKTTLMNAVGAVVALGITAYQKISHKTLPPAP